MTNEKPNALKRRDALKMGVALAARACLPISHAIGAERLIAKVSKNQEPAASFKRRYRHLYHQSLVYKIMIGGKTGTRFLQMDEALEIVKQTAVFTRGLKQIVFMVGWQFGGHDSKYPAWSEVNPHIKMPGDPDARTSLVWFMNEARKHNAVVSVHVNPTDAYENSPLWQSYVGNDLIQKNADGSLKKGGMAGGEQTYQVCKTREWQTGYLQKRIDGLLDLLPIRESGTIHLDAFVASDDPGHGITAEDELNAMAEAVKYWGSRGVDVTSEDFNYRFIHLIPMVLHLNLEERGRLMYPPQVICGGGCQSNARYGIYGHGRYPELSRPEGGCLYEEAWGLSVDMDVFGVRTVPQLAEEFFLKTLPWHYLNQSRPLQMLETAESYEVFFENGARTRVTHGDFRVTLQHMDRVYADGTDVFVPAMWLKKECITFSLKGCRRTWKLPPDWGNIGSVLVTQIYPLGGHQPKRVSVIDGTVEIELLPKHASSVNAA